MPFIYNSGTNCSKKLLSTFKNAFCVIVLCCVIVSITKQYLSEPNTGPNSVPYMFPQLTRYMRTWSKCRCMVVLPTCGLSTPRIVQHGWSTVRFVHCSVCPLSGLPTVTFRHQLGSTTPRIHHWWSNH